jgi:hydrogenase maturation protease
MNSAGKPVLVLAIGSTLRGDDGIAWRIGEALLENLVQPGVEVVFTELLLPEHAVPLSTADMAIFIDCSAMTEPGEVSMIPLSPAQDLPRIFTHHLVPASLLKLTQDLCGRAPATALAITVGGQSFELSDDSNGQLSERVEAAIPIAVEAVRAAVFAVEQKVRS